MATQRTQKDGKADKMSIFGIAVSSFVVYVIFSIAGGLLFSTFVGSLLSNLISFSILGIALYFVLHFLLPNQMSMIDTRLLHEFAKRKLIEFRD